MFWEAFPNDAGKRLTWGTNAHEEHAKHEHEHLKSRFSVTFHIVPMKTKEWSSLIQVEYKTI